MCALLPGQHAASVTRSGLIASLAFNLAEVALRLPIALSGIASAMIWVTVVSHRVVAVLSALQQVASAA